MQGSPRQSVGSRTQSDTATTRPISCVDPESRLEQSIARSGPTRQTRLTDSPVDRATRKRGQLAQAILTNARGARTNLSHPLTRCITDPSSSLLTNMSVAPAFIDMRSDTVTKPTAAMRSAMANADVGDDVFGDDPTVLELQRQCATLLGKEAGLFVPSGTMGNLISLLVHVDARGGEMILGDQSHIHFYEQGNSAQFGGIHSRTVRNQPDGTLDLAEIERAIRPPNTPDDHLPQTQLICIENTQNRMGGRVLSVEYMDALGALAKKHGVKLHVDGARLLNASVALCVPPAALVASADSVSLCLSKGLAAPVGSVIVGTTDFIRRAKRLRKALGGGMRQVGILAAAGLLAINVMAKGLAADHAHAKQLAKAFQSVKGIIVPPIENVETNILYIELDGAVLSCTAAQLVAAVKAQGLLVTATDVMKIRFVTHYMIDDAAIARSIELVTKAVESFRK